MGDVLLPATSGRAKCRGCGEPIRTGELRFGESLPNPYGEGESLYWFHPICATCMRPEKVLPVLTESEVNIPDREWMMSAAEAGLAHRRLPRLARAERSKSGKARCRSCREPIAGGVVRLALCMFEEGRMSPIGFIHVECANNYFGTTDIVERVRRLSPDLDEAALSELSERLENQREPPPPEAPSGTPQETAHPAPEGAPARDADAISQTAETRPGGPDVAKARPAENGRKQAL